MKNIILPHKVCDYTCMVNGLEDQYEWKTGERLPDFLIFFLSGMSGFTYISQKNAPTQRMVFWGSNPKSQYETLQDIMNYKWSFSEGRTFKFVLDSARSRIEENMPVIMGALDMYHLPYYEKFYHRIHVPIHYIQMVGYDDEKGCAYILDCGQQEVMQLTYTDLEKSLNVQLPGLSKKNTIHWFEFGKNIPDLKEVVYKGLKKKGNFMLNPPVKFLGIAGIKKLASEISGWEKELGKPAFRKCLYHLVEYTGSVVPMLPSKLLRYPMESFFDVHQGTRDKFAKVLSELSNKYNSEEMKQAAELFYQSGKRIQNITDIITDTLLNTKNEMDMIPEILLEIVEIEERAFGILTLLK